MHEISLITSTPVNEYPLQEPTITADNEAKIVVAEELVEVEAKPQTEVVEMACGGKAMPNDVKWVEKDLFCVSQASSGRVIPPRMDVTLLGLPQR